MVNKSDKVGNEVPKEYRTIVSELTTNQGWGYDKHRKGHPRLYPADTTKDSFSVPTTPGDRRSLNNFIAQVRRSGGIWPPQRTPR